VEISHKYEPLFYNTTRYFIITGGRGSAKSFSVNVFLALMTYEVGHRVLFTRYTMASAHKSIIPELLEKIDLMQKHPDFDVNRNEIKNVVTDSSIIFSGIKTSSGNQTANLKSLQGITTWVLDEAEEMTDEETFDTIDLSVRNKQMQNRIILIMNPASKEHWVYKRFFQQAGVQPGFNGVKNDVTYIHTDYRDNKEHLADSYLRQIAEIKRLNPAKYQHKILGSWMDKAEGVIFENWVLGDFDNSLPFIFGQDFGYSVDPTTLIKVAIDEKRKIIYLQELLYRTGLSTDMIAFENKQKAKDGLIVADSAEPRLIAELKSKPHYCNIVPAQKGPDSVRSGIAKMRDYKMIVTPESINLVKELNHYIWSDKKSNVPVDDYNHCLDAARYAFERLSRKRTFVAV